MTKPEQCKYLKNVIIKDSPDDFIIAERFRYGLTDDEVRAGIKAFRAFLCGLYDKIEIEKPEIEIHEFAAFLYMMGAQSHLEIEPRRELAILGSDMMVKTKPRSQPHLVMKKMPAKRVAEILQFLSEMGFCFMLGNCSAISLQPVGKKTAEPFSCDALNYTKPIKLAETGNFRVTNESDGDIIIGLKLIAMAQVNTDTDWDRIQNGFMRCHFLPLASDTPMYYDMKMINFAETQPPEIRDWLLHLDKLLVDNRCVPDAEILSHAIVTYNLAKKMVCRIELKISECIITVNTIKAKSLDDIASVLSADFVTALAEDGCECGRGCKKGPYRIEHNGTIYLSCNNPPHKLGGFNISLGSPENRRIMHKWVEMELGVCAG